MKILRNIPTDDGCMALINPSKYKSYHDGSFGSPEFLSEAKNCSAIFWGVERGNWNIEVSNEEPQKAYDCIEGTLVSDGKLAFCSYDELTNAAMYEGEKLPPEGCENWFVDVPKGIYLCKVSMMFNPETISEENKIQSDDIHFHVFLSEIKEIEKILSSIHWYSFDSYT